MNQAKSVITLYRSNRGIIIDWDKREEWYIDRTEGMSYRTCLTGEEAAEEAFHITNAPEDCLSDEQKIILKEQQFKGSPLSVGDVVRVSPILRKGTSDYFLCKSFGWEKFCGDYFKLLRFLN